MRSASEHRAPRGGPCTEWYGRPSRTPARPGARINVTEPARASQRSSTSPSRDERTSNRAEPATEHRDEPPVPATVKVRGDADRTRSVDGDPRLVGSPGPEPTDLAAVRTDPGRERGRQLGQEREAFERRHDVIAVDLHPHARSTERPRHPSQRTALDLATETDQERLAHQPVDVREPPTRDAAERRRQRAPDERPAHPNPGRCLRNRMNPMPAAVSSRKCAITIGHARLVRVNTNPNSTPIATLPRNPPQPWYRW